MRRRKHFREFTPEELAFVYDLKQSDIRVERDSTIIPEDTRSPNLYTVLRGWGFRYKTLPDGRRQILNYVLPGDLIGLQTAVFEVMDHGVQSLTEMLICVFPRDRLMDIHRQCPSLAFDVTWMAARQERLLDESLLSMGRRSAKERVAATLLHFYRRAEEAGLAEGGRFALPVTQQQLADTLGLSLVHTNRSLKALRATGSVLWKNGMVEIRDLDQLIAIVGADLPAERARPFI